MPFRETVATNIKLIRERNSLSRADFGHILGKSENTIRYWETGMKTPSTESLLNISKRFNISIDSLLDNDSSISTNAPITPATETNSVSHLTERLSPEGREVILKLIKMLPSKNQQPLKEAVDESGMYMNHFILSVNHDGSINEDYDKKYMLVDDEVPRGAIFAVTLHGSICKSLDINGKTIYVSKTPNLKQGDLVLFLINQTLCLRIFESDYERAALKSLDGRDRITVDIGSDQYQYIGKLHR